MDHRPELKDAINLLADLTEAYTAALFLRERGGENLRAAVWHSFANSFRHDAAIRPSEGVVGFVAKHGVPADVDRYHQPSQVTKVYSADEGVKAFLALPVGDFGVLFVDTKARQIFGEREKKTIRDFAAFFAHLVVQQDTCSREAMYGRILDLLYDVENSTMAFGDPRQYFAEVLDAGRRYTGLSMGLLCLLHQGRRQFMVEAVEGPSLSTLRGRSFPVSSGLVGWVFREMKPLTHSRLSPLPGKSYLVSPEEPMRGYNAFVGVPLLAWRSLIGVWAFAGRTERQIDDEEERALQLAGNRLAATIEHYRLGSAKS